MQEHIVERNPGEPIRIPDYGLTAFIQATAM